MPTAGDSSQSESEDSGSRYIRSNTYTDENWLREQYSELEKSPSEIADEIGVCESTVKTYLDRHGIQRRQTPGSATGDTEPLRDAEWLRDQYINKEKTQTQIASELDIHSTTVSNWMALHGIETTHDPTRDSSSGTIEPLKNKPWLYEQYVEQEKSLLQIADSLGVSPTTVSRYRDEHGIESRHKGSKAPVGNVTPLKSEEWLREQYVDQGKTLSEIAESLSVSSTTVNRYRDDHGIDSHNMSDAQSDGDAALVHDSDWLDTQYTEKARSMEEIADELGISKTTVHSWLHRHGIETRNRGERTQNTARFGDE